MVRKVVELGGVAVYANRPVVLVLDSLVLFADGSWCNVKTGQIEQYDRANISIAQPEEKNQRVVSDALTFFGNAIEFTNLAANIEIEIHDEMFIEVVTDLHKLESESIEMIRRGNTVVVTEAFRGDYTSLSVIKGKQNPLFASESLFVAGTMNGLLFIEEPLVTQGNDHLVDAQIRVKVPVGTAIRVENITGKIIVGDTKANLHVRSNGALSVFAGQVGNTFINFSASGYAKVSEVQGDLTVDLSGSGNVYVEGGAIGRLDIDIYGSGDVKVNSWVENAVISTSRAGLVYVAHVEEQPVFDAAFQENVRFGNW